MKKLQTRISRQPDGCATSEANRRYVTYVSIRCESIRPIGANLTSAVRVGKEPAVRVGRTFK